MSKTTQKLLAALSMVPFSIAWSAYVLVIMWEWFVVPLGVQSISMGHAYGLTVLLALASGKAYQTSDEESLLKIAISAALTPLFTLLFGYTAHVWMGW